MLSCSVEGGKVSLINKLVWKLFSLKEREYLLSTLKAHEQGGIKKILNNRATFPEAFDDRKIILIEVPKAASSSLAAALYDGKRYGHLPLKYYETLSSQPLSIYFKIAFVRNPWARALSAYNYLRQGGAGKRDQKWAKLMNSFESFDHFVSTWLNEDNIYKQIHFVPQRKFLEDTLGMVNLDYIGRYENLEEGFNELKESLGLVVDLPKIKMGSSIDYKEIYTKHTREKVGYLYKQDIDEFGYEF
ncbi:sulfotransferase [Cycloclasticus sp. PY97N]|nr:sulfotransferase [Cycloclasticus sp. PY97N]